MSCQVHVLDKDLTEAAGEGYAGSTFEEEPSRMAAALRYPIAAVSRLTGLSLDTIRAWERRYAAVTPDRGARGRVYTQAQVQRLRTLAALVEQGHPIGDVASLPDARLDALLRGTLDAERPAPRTSSPADAPPIARVLAAVERFDYAAADREVGHLAALYPPRDLVYVLTLPLMRTVGERWHAGTLSIAQEHLASAILRAVMSSLVRLQRPPAGAPRLLFATPDTELHEFGILAAAMLSAAAGLDPVYLGPEVPADDIGRAAAESDASVVVIGLSGGSRTAAAKINDIRRAVPSSVEMWAGGPSTLALSPSAGRRGRVLPLATFEEYEHHLLRLGGRPARTAAQLLRSDA